MKWFLFLICLLLPTYQIRFKIFGLPTTLLEVMILTLFLVWLIKKIKIGNWKLEIACPARGNWKFLILSWLLVGLVAIFVSPDKWLALGHWRAYFLEPILLLVIFIDLAKRDTNLPARQLPTISCKSLLLPQNKAHIFKSNSHQLALAGGRIHANEMNKQKNHSTIRANRRNGYKLINLILVGLSISVLVCSVWAILQKFFGGGVLSTEVLGAPQVWRATGLFPQPNFLGLYLAPIIILAVVQLISNFEFRISNFKRLLVASYWSLVIITGLVAIILARSEGAILGVLAGLIFLGLVLGPARKWTIVSLCLLALIISLLPSTRNYFLEKIFFKDLSGQLRLNIWQGAFNLIKDRPIFGAGLRGYQQLVPQYQKPFYNPQTGQLISVETHPYPHNLFLAIWSELGIFGLIVFVLILVKFFKFGFQKLFRNLKFEIGNSELTKSKKILITTSLSAMVTILIHGLVDTPYFKNDLSILFWLIIGQTIIEFQLKKGESIRKIV